MTLEFLKDTELAQVEGAGWVGKVFEYVGHCVASMIKDGGAQAEAGMREFG